ncbi:hypothetical protein IQ251_03990 [Saccharopolyspora sp. HNM0983]|uniref:Uncharacterized protein n=1 Tax=Saccharopolyspora montiporae TaxID=2781240 RepID=A0A929B7G6_9PSEU|nr:hypothetical protein [Saccharopolyspora sp. HNM0983]MBE9373605.1 hypothetical protein [Saccharopolyspora sp. HNM0983]
MSSSPAERALTYPLTGDAALDPPQECPPTSRPRSVSRSVLDVLLRRLPALDLAVPVAQLRPLTGRFASGLRELPVRW